MAIALLCLLSYGGLRLVRARTFQFFGGLVPRVDTDANVVALTIDDGPEPGATEELVAILQRHGVRATFFLIGADMERHPELVQAIVAAGHQLGNHSYSHHRMVFKSPAFIRQEVEKTSRLIRAAGYRGPMVFRPPHGKKLLYLPYYLRTQGIPTIMWDVEPDSYSDLADSPTQIIAHSLTHVRPGSIILLHAMNRRPSLAAVEPLLTALQQEHYRFVTVSELLQEGLPRSAVGAGGRP